MRVYSMSISWHVETFIVRKLSPFKYLKFFSQNAETTPALAISAQKWCLFDLIWWGSGSISWHVETFVVRKLTFLNIWSFSAKMLNHSGPFHFGPKVVFFLIFYNICPYTPFKGISGLGSISWHCETFFVRKLAHLNIWSFSAKMLNHSGLCHFSPKVVFIWFFTIFTACRDICCDETNLFKYLKFFSQNAEPLRPFPFRPKSGVYLIFYNIYLPLHPFQRQMRVYSMSISWHVETFIVRKLSPFKYLKFFSQNAEPHRPLPFRPKSGVYLIFYNIYLPLHPF